MNGVTFGNKHSFRDWGLILKSRPYIKPPEPKTVYIDVPEADGSLDLTESLSGQVKYENREIICEFSVLDHRKRWSSLYSEIMNFLHGKRMQVILDEDPSYFYIGRLSVDEWASDMKSATISITGEVEPWKYDLYDSLTPWLWDTFNFESDIIREYSNITVSNSKNMIVIGSRKPIVPTFIVSGSNMGVTFQGINYNLQTGRNRIGNIAIMEGENQLTFTGNGIVSIEYRGGSL